MTKGMIIDSPGYGHTYAPKKVKNQWSKMMVGYLSHSVRLSLVLMLVHSDLGLKACDIDMLDKLKHYNKKVQVVFSKVDRIKGGQGVLE